MVKIVIKDEYRDIFCIKKKIINNLNTDSMIGKSFNKLTVIAYAGKDKWYDKLYLCRCNCDNRTEKIISKNSLLSNHTKSCGCLKTGEMIRYNTTHNMSNTSEYNIWNLMKGRCYNTNSKAYSNYGGRGITIYDEWIDNFQTFYEYIGPRPGKEYTIDRINVDGNYEPGNIRWSTRTIQSRNQRVLKSNKLGYAGIHLRKGKYRVRITSCNKVISIGTYKTLSEAILARMFAEWKYWGIAQVKTKPIVKII